MGGRNLVGDRPFDHLLYHVGFLFSPGHQHDPVGPHHRVDAHGHGHLGRVLQPEKGRGLHLARVVGELYQARARLGVGTRLVEADLSLLAHADNHQVDPADALVEGCAVCRDALLGDGSIGDVDVFGLDVDVVEELLVDAVVAALLLRGADRVEFVEAVNGHVAEADQPLPVAAHQLAVESQRGAARGKPQHEELRFVINFARTVLLFVLEDHPDNQVGHVLYALVFAFVNQRADFLVPVDDVARRRRGNQASVAG